MQLQPALPANSLHPQYHPFAILGENKNLAHVPLSVCCRYSTPVCPPSQKPNARNTTKIAVEWQHQTQRLQYPGTSGTCNQHTSPIFLLGLCLFWTENSDVPPVFPLLSSSPHRYEVHIPASKPSFSLLNFPLALGFLDENEEPELVPTPYPGTRVPGPGVCSVCLFRRLCTRHKCHWSL